MKKKKVMTMLLTAVAIISVAGCSNNFGENANTAASEGLTVSEVASNAEDTADSAEVADGTETETAGDEEITYEDYVALNYDNTMLYIVDAQGNLIADYDLEEIKEKFADQGIKLDGSYFKRYSDGILYYCTDSFNSTDSSSYATVYAVDPEKWEVREVYRTGKDESADCVDVINGKLYFQTSKQGMDDYTGHCYSIGEGLNYQEVEDTACDGYFDASFDNSVVQCINKLGDLHYASYIFDKVGYIVGKSENELFRLDKDGNSESIYNPEAGYNTVVYFYDRSKVIYYLRDADYNWLGVYVLDIESGRSDLITEESNTYFLGFDNGVFYYNVTDYGEHGSISQKMYAYDTADGSTRLILDEATIPGTGNDSLIYNSSSVAGNNLFVPRFDDGKFVWSVADMTSEKIEFKSLGFVAKEYSLFNYGIAEAITASYACPDCGQNLAEYYGEKFILDSKYSEHADEINRELSDYIEGSANVTVNDSEYFNSSCEDHQASPDMYIVSDEDRIADVCIIDDRYLGVELSGYWYGGGAHGMPSKGQFLFDLTTGQRLNVKDFYKGTDEDFKKLIASKVKEDYIKNNDGYTYFAASEDEAYDQAYESANPDDRVIFRPDGVDFSFYPYDLGPYASGFITMHLTYDELLGRSSLSE